jgi:aldose sugar dehydrogenase
MGSCSIKGRVGSGNKLAGVSASSPAAAAFFLLAIFAASSLAQSFSSSHGSITVETVARGLESPWGLAFLPDGRMLVTERPGRILIVTRAGALSPPLIGVPNVFPIAPGGLLDVALDRKFAVNHKIYFCFAEPVSGGSRTALASASVIDDDKPRLENVQLIFRQKGPLSPGQNFGCRIAQWPDDSLFLTTGDNFLYADEAQNLRNHLGKIVRIRPDGSVPPDNPFVGREDALPEIWSYGHRNAQGAAIHPLTGKLWMHEHGPQGGDEVNVVGPGKNYGWPVIGYGIGYAGDTIHESTHKEGMEQPIWYWRPGIAPSGMAFYTGSLFPNWRSSLFVGALGGQMLVRLALDGEHVIGEERLLSELGERIRDVRQGPDEALWLLTDNVNGRVLRIVPAK